MEESSLSDANINNSMKEETRGRNRYPITNSDYFLQLLEDADDTLFLTWFPFVRIKTRNQCDRTIERTLPLNY